MSENKDGSNTILGECSTNEETSAEVAILVIPQPQPVIELPVSCEIKTNMNELIKWAKNRKELILSKWKDIDGKEITDEIATLMSKDAEDEISSVKSTIAKITEMRTESLRPMKESVRSVEKDVAEVIECFNGVITILSPIVSKAKNISKKQREERLLEAFGKVADSNNLRTENRSGFSVPDSILNKKTLTSKDAKEFVENFVADLLKIQKENDDKVEFATFACKEQSELFGLTVPLDHNEIGSLKLLTTVEIASMINAKAKKQKEIEEAAKNKMDATEEVVEPKEVIVETKKVIDGNQEWTQDCTGSNQDDPPNPEGKKIEAIVKISYHTSQKEWLNNLFVFFKKFGITVERV